MYVCINLGARGQLDSLEHLSSTVGKTRTMLPTRKPLERFTYFRLAYSCSPRILQRDKPVTTSHNSMCPLCEMNQEGSLRVCSDVVLFDFWCGFADIFILTCSTAVIQNQAVCGTYMQKFSGNFNAVCSFLKYFILCCVYNVFLCSFALFIPPYFPFNQRLKSVLTKE